MVLRFPLFLLAMAAFLLWPAQRAEAQFTAPPRGLNTLTGRALSFGYLNALRSATGTTDQKMAALNYDGVDAVLLAFATLNTDGSLSMTGNAATYRSALLTNAHQRSKSVLFSVTGNFEIVAASATLRQALANSVLSLLEQYGFDGVDFDWEWPNTAQLRTNFTAMMQAVHTTVKARSPNYIVAFVQGPGYWLGGTDWAAVSSVSDFCFMICYDWKNPANGPITKPGSVQYLGLGGTIEASGRGAVDYAVSNGYPRSRIVVGIPFYSSDLASWFTDSAEWETNKTGYLAAIDPDSREVFINGGWQTSPDCVKRKMDALLDAHTSVFAGGAVARGVGFWEFGHEATANPQLTAAIAAWKNGDRSVTGPAVPTLPGTTTLIAHGPGWRYYDSTTSTPPATWKDRTFSDTSWRLGATPLGFGDGDEETVVDPTTSRITTYFRRAFSVSTPSSINALTLRLVRDDGAVVYLNGTEVFRNNLPLTGAITATTLADVSVGTGAEESYEALVLELPPSLLVTGANALAIEIHQAGINSSDITMDAELIASSRVEPVLVPSHAWWRFRDSATAPAANWNTGAFSDTAWSTGRGRLGYGNDGEWTPLTWGADAANKPLVAWFRHTFQLTDSPRFDSLRVRLQCDDGAAVYLNGTELFRDNLPEGVLTTTTRALAAAADEQIWQAFIVPASALVKGRNVVAVETHQAAPDSSDLGLDLELTGIVLPSLTATRSGSQIILTVPATFSNWALESSTAPGGVWTAVTATPVLTGGMLRYTLPATAPRQFFRLLRTGD